MKAALTFSRRIGITVARNEWDYPKQKTTAEEHLEKSNLLNNVKLLRMFALGAEDYNEKTHIKAINHLVSE